MPDGRRSFPSVTATLMSERGSAFKPSMGPQAQRSVGIPTVVMKLDMNNLRFGQWKTQGDHGMYINPQQVYGARLTFWTLRHEYTSKETSVLLFSTGEPGVVEVMLLEGQAEIEKIVWSEWNFTVTMLCELPTGTQQSNKTRRGSEPETEIMVDFTAFQEFAGWLGIVRVPQINPFDIFPVRILQPLQQRC